MWIGVWGCWGDVSGQVSAGTMCTLRRRCVRPSPLLCCCCCLSLSIVWGIGLEGNGYDRVGISRKGLTVLATGSTALPPSLLLTRRAGKVSRKRKPWRQCCSVVWRRYGCSAI